jgi:hypothetical protein
VSNVGCGNARDCTLIGTALCVDSTQTAVRSAATKFVMSQHEL